VVCVWELNLASRAWYEYVPQTKGTHRLQNWKLEKCEGGGKWGEWEERKIGKRD